MSRRNWKTVQPRDLRDALDLCVECAREKHNRSIDQIADMMGLPSKWTLYKWIQDASLPIRMIKPFELSCGADFVSRWGVVSTGKKMVVDIPTGRHIKDTDIMALQQVTNEAIAAVIKFSKNLEDLEGTLGLIQTALEHFAWHKHNVEKSKQPELPFDED